MLFHYGTLHLRITLNLLCIDTYLCIVSKVIGINKENKYIYQTRNT